ncbi:hypothetical protein [Dermatophilus congolensis]|uniref:Uncharacterized protein n=1 Tax=Dermatophilus congolensis TaxID=1863 RepID=A0A239VCU3_9MICO|nr:hypothetical protein [Dermatophilus congolensis]MBO3141877.1 hypothetical protein [Dermatophilus congolensis]MBO3148580.1 hypothetical protein [Dermatophilus congolensis]MBO3153077.1 hypothetical protein [Dermatophilus congolensis]MBO3173406.1 hypothetical protein [Dermatophilus congolensis]MBO3180152.1 hypothetical protein [Dermatophilus congolensis]
MDVAWQIVAGLVPSIGVVWLFYRIMKALVEADRNERRAQAEWDMSSDASSSRIEGEEASRESSRERKQP